MKWGKDILPKSLLILLSKVNPYLLSTLVIGVAALICSPLYNTEGYYVVSFVFLFVVSILATFLRIGPVLLASTLGSLVWNFFFIPPHFTFHIDKAEDILMFCMFFIVALLNGITTTRIKRQEQISLEREERTNALFQITRELSKASGINEVLTGAIENIKSNFSIEPFFLLQDGNNMLQYPERLKTHKKLSKEENDIALWVFKNGEKAGKQISFFPNSNYTFLPLLGVRINPGVVFFKTDSSLSSEKEVFRDTVFTLISNALEREFLGELAQKAKLLVESDKLYKTLFNTISHELRIPVATILGASDTLLTGFHPENVQMALHNEIFTASLRLNRLIENLLNMSRLESGRISLRLDWCDVNDLINKVAQDLKDELKPFNLLVSIPDDMPLVKIDFGLMEQVLYNLLINSCEHSPVASNIRIKTYPTNDKIVFEILDRGSGFPEEAIQNVFRKFYRVESNKSGGLGLGLSIVKGFVEAHKGSVFVENRKNGGARFVIMIPSLHHEIENLPLDDL